MTAHASQASPGLSLGRLLSFGFFVPRAAPDPGDSAEAARARRAFIHDTLSARPDAFASELDVQSMMHCYPGRF